MKYISNRSIYLDSIKVICIIFVVVGHSIALYYGKDYASSYWNNRLVFFIYSFHMPLFIAVSGYLLGKSSHKKQNIKTLLIQRFKRLMVPVIILGCMWFLLNLCWGVLETRSTIKSIYKSFTIYWFLPCLYLLTTFTKCLHEFNKKGEFLLILIFLLLVIFYEKLPIFLFKDIQFIRMFPIFYLSYKLGLNSDIIKNYLQKWILPIFLVSSLLWLYLSFIFGCNVMTYSLVERIFLGLVSSSSVASFVYWIYDYIPKNIILSISKNTLGIYLIHIIIYKFLQHNFHMDNIILCIITCVLLIALSLLISENLHQYSYSKKYILGEL